MREGTMAAQRRPIRLRDILPTYGIATIAAFARQAAMSHQQCWNLWHGYAGVGTRMMQRLHDRLGLPLDVLLQITPPTPPPRTHPPNPRGRPRKPRPDGETEKE
jgi:hypothetical protein